MTHSFTGIVTGGTNTVFTYDDWGRTVTKSMSGHLATYQYRYGDKLKKLSTDFPDEATGNVGYVFDGLGKRRIRNNNGANYTWWRWDVGWNPIAKYDDSDTDWDVEGLSETYIPGLAEIAGSDPSSGTYRYYSEDHLGSVRRMRDGNKASLATYEYDPYGGQYAFSGLALNHGFTGHTWEPNAALYYAPYRYYNPTAARWLTRDPLGMVEGANVYQYGGNRPTLFADPLGLMSEGEGDGECDPYKSCDKYDALCKTTGDPYYCYVAPLVCRNTPDGPWSNCVRDCLAGGTYEECGAHPSGECLSRIHAACWLGCLGSS